MKKLNKKVLAALACTVCSTAGYSASSDQYASSVIGFSTQYSATTWSASQTLGAPNVTAYGDNSNAWTSSSINGTTEFVALGYTTPVYAYGVTIRETWGNGFVTKVELRDTSNVWRTAWTGTDTSLPGSVANFFLSWAPTTYKANGVRVTVNTNHNLTTWEEIDSVQLSGVTDNLTPAVSLTAPDTVSSESFSSPGLFVISRGLTPTTAPLTVQYNITGTAVNGSDYNVGAPLTGTVVIPANVRSVGLSIKPADDTVKEVSEKVTLTLVASPNYQVMSKFATASVTINSNE